LEPRVPRLRLPLPRPGNDLGAADPADLRREGEILMRALMLLLLLVAACTPDFAAKSDVTDLRILAVQAEPPEAQYDPTQTPPPTPPPPPPPPRRRAARVSAPGRAAAPPPPSPMPMPSHLGPPPPPRRCDEGPATEPVVRSLSPTTLQVPPAALMQALTADD